MKCYHCGSEIRDNSIECIYCGYKQKQNIPQKEKKTKIKTKIKIKKRYIIILIIILILIPILTIATITAKYYTALYQIEHDETYEAAKTFSKIKSVASIPIENFISSHIDELCNENRYDDASLFVSSMIAYDVIDRIDSYSIFNDISYQNAQYLESLENYREAYDIYIKLGSYRDSKEKTKELYDIFKDDMYNEAVQYYELYVEFKMEGYLYTAEKLFNQLSGYKDSDIYSQNIKQQYIIIQENELKEYYESLITDPYIGMTREELAISTWGDPIDINETITVYGTSEQWVYSGYKYVYLTDGIVTAIQK